MRRKRDQKKLTMFLNRLRELGVINQYTKKSPLASPRLDQDLLRDLIAKYTDKKLSVAKRRKAGEAIQQLLQHYRNYYKNLNHPVASTAQQKTFWQRLKELPWQRYLKKTAFTFLVCCGIINATAEAFDGVSSILFALHVPYPAILGNCVILGLFSICLYFAFELTQLSNAMGIPFIDRYSEANRLLEIQSLVGDLKVFHEQKMIAALRNHNLKQYTEELQQLNGLFTSIQPLRQVVNTLKTEQPSRLRSGVKYGVAALAGFLSGAIAFFNGESLLHVISTLTGIAIGANLMWLPTVLGVACFLVVTSVSLVNEGRSMMKLIDKLLGRPAELIEDDLDLDKWSVNSLKAQYFNVAQDYLCRRKPVQAEIDEQALDSYEPLNSRQQPTHQTSLNFS